MHVLIVNFNLTDMTGEEWALEDAPRLAPAFANLPGLVSKIWLANDKTNTYGGIYLWTHRGAMDEFLASDLAAAVRAHPHLRNLTLRYFAVLEDVTRVTQPIVDVLRTARV
jgi:hypothetical protein